MILFKEKIPKFVFSGRLLSRREVPIFIFHRVNPQEFTGYLEYLKSNSYYTLSTDELYGHIKNRKPIPQRSVLLTFDDGLINNWGVVFPLLKKFKMKATFFVNPEEIDASQGIRMNLEDVWAGRAKIEELNDCQTDLSCISWQEALEMQKSGLIDIQSHTLAHKQCFISPEIIDFQHPRLDGKPEYRWLWTAMGTAKDTPTWGAPVYRLASRMACRRYIDDITFRNSCIDFVKAKGGALFFKEKNWRKVLDKAAKEYRSSHPLQDRYETKDEQRGEIKRSLVDSKKIIEDKLKSHCGFIALPWNQSSSLTIELIKYAGYKANFSGTNPLIFPRAGVNPYHLNRVVGYWIKSLPGRERIGIWNKLSKKLALNKQ